MLMVFMTVLLKHSLVQPLVDYLSWFLPGEVNLSSVDFVIIQVGTNNISNAGVDPGFQARGGGGGGRS